MRNHEKGRRTRRKDFQSVFDVTPEWVEFAEITRGDLIRNPGGTINAVLIDPAPEIVRPKPSER